MATPFKSLLMRFASILPEGLLAELRRRHYERKLRRARLTDEPDLAAIALLTKPGDTVLDIGANFGLFTRFLSESVGKDGRVFSFEPTSDMFGVLENNRARLRLENTSVFRTALSNRCGVSEMAIPIREDGSLNHYEASLVDTTGGDGKTLAVRVETRTLDDFCDDLGVEKIDFIKCDVEGHEIEVLEGARRTLAHHRPAMLMEVNEPLDAGGHGSRVLELVRSLGYEVHTLHGEELRPWQPGEVSVNYVLKPV
jgi:FkbM family methyltransferase